MHLRVFSLVRLHERTSFVRAQEIILFLGEKNYRKNNNDIVVANVPFLLVVVELKKIIYSIHIFISPMFSNILSFIFAGSAVLHYYSKTPKSRDWIKIAQPLDLRLVAR